MNDIVILIDGNSFLYRFYNAIQTLTTKTGIPTNAVYGLTRKIMSLLKEREPSYLAVAFDLKEPTFRHEYFADYKANRPKMPPDLVQQLPYVKDVLSAMGVAVVEMEGYEADDVIGTIAKQAEVSGIDTYILTQDKDMLQLVSDKIFVEVKDSLFNAEKVEEKYSVPPKLLPDLFGLAGDKVDNIKGVPGIGLKTAAKLIQQLGPLEQILQYTKEISNKKTRERLEDSADEAKDSKYLVTIDTGALIDTPLSTLKVGEPDVARLVSLFTELEFASLIKEWQTEQEKPTGKIAESYEEFTRFFSNHSSCDTVAILIEHASPADLYANFAGFSFAMESDTLYVPVVGKHAIAMPYILEVITPFLGNRQKTVVVWNIKPLLYLCKKENIPINCSVFDVMLAAYLEDSSKRNYNLDVLGFDILGKSIESYDELLGKGKKAISFDQAPLPKAASFSCTNALAALEMKPLLAHNLSQLDMKSLLLDVEQPLSEVLVAMEITGIKVDKSILQELGKECEHTLQRLEQEIYGIAGEEFNINSTQQLASILFDKLQLPILKKTPKGVPSTDSKVLEALSLQNDFPLLVLTFRELSKLKSTYIDALPKLIDEGTGRIHTTFNQAGTATGRLSSNNPNLQNIPIRTEMGQKIRAAFVAEEGNLLLSADYSQIELRVLAHLSGDEKLLKAFLADEDIHVSTASNIFGIDKASITPETRRRAKAVNFGIIYGMSPFGLARDVGISQTEAKEFIDSYFATYPVVSSFISQVKSDAKREGFTSTILKRRRYIHDLDSHNKNKRQLAERTAINSVIQGSAADIIKVAMVEVHKAMADQGVSSQMIVQVHDELVFEVPKDELPKMKTLVRNCMENVLDFQVPLKVTINSGANWAVLK